MKSWLTRLVAKIEHFHGREYCGYLTPTEIVSLYDKGFVPVSVHFDLTYVREKMKRGESNPSWHYFQLKPNTELTQLIGGRDGFRQRI